MKTVSEIEEQSQIIRDRMDSLVAEIAGGFTEVRALQIAEELALLLRESKMLQRKIKYFNDMAEQLFLADCSGPH